MQPLIEPIDSKALLELDIAPPKAIINNLVFEGLNILAAPPKAGKSFMALGLAHAVATGRAFLGETTSAPGPVLYLAYEDTHYRIKTRMMGLSLGASPQLVFLIRPPTLENETLEFVNTWLQENKGSLVVIDTLGRAEGNRKDEHSYSDDQLLGSALQEIAFENHAAILAIHHTRKAGHGDFLQQIRGNIAAAADVVMSLNRERESSFGKLMVTGRDLGERVLNVRFNSKLNGWERL